MARTTLAGTRLLRLAGALLFIAGAAVFMGVITAVGVCVAGRRKAVAIPLVLSGSGALGVGIFPGHTGGIRARLEEYERPVVALFEEQMLDSR